MDRNLMNLLETVGALRYAETPDAGGAAADGDGESGDAGDDDTDDEPLGENGLKALKSERLRAAQAKKRADAAEARLKEIEDA